MHELWPLTTMFAYILTYERVMDVASAWLGPQLLLLLFSLIYPPDICRTWLGYGICFFLTQIRVMPRNDFHLSFIFWLIFLLWFHSLAMSWKEKHCSKYILLSPVLLRSPEWARKIYMNIGQVLTLKERTETRSKELELAVPS